MNNNSKRATASIAALQILLYHCWIPVFGYGSALGQLERFLIAATYSGVDVFFFISAYSLASRPVENYKKFIVSRANKLLPLFFIALIFGHFLWFIPSIMVMYLVFPPLYHTCRKKPSLSFVLLIAGWAALVYLVLGVIRPATDYGIFLFRIPSIILGAYAAGCTVKIDKRTSKQVLQRKNCCTVGTCAERRNLTTVAGILLLAVGTILIYKFGYIHKLNTPFKGTFYLMGIPTMLGTVLLTGSLFSGINSRIISFFGSMTLELYFTQMVLGTLLISLVFRLTGSRIVTNILSLVIITAIAAAIKIINDKIINRLQTK